MSACKLTSACGDNLGVCSSGKKKIAPTWNCSQQGLWINESLTLFSLSSDLWAKSDISTSKCNTPAVDWTSAEGVLHWFKGFFEMSLVLQSIEVMCYDDTCIHKLIKTGDFHRYNCDGLNCRLFHICYSCKKIRDVGGWEWPQQWRNQGTFMTLPSQLS